MPDILLTTINARYTHAAFGLRYLLANLGPLQSQATLLEFDLEKRTLEMAEAILATQAKIVGVGVYIWNAEPAARLVALLKHIRPELIIILGGPEVSHETDRQAIIQTADYVICGEGEVAFRELCQVLLSGTRPTERIIHPPPPPLDQLQLPYDLYTREDIQHRLVYVEASRGCPFKCAFCLSALDQKVRRFPQERFLDGLDQLYKQGLRAFKFVDRTFNLEVNHSLAILHFFLERLTPDLFLHFEVIPDRLPEPLKEIIARFPEGILQFEVGIQSYHQGARESINRRQDDQAAHDNLLWLCNQTGVHLHTDLIAGLPHEDLISFAAGFDRLVAISPQEIQVGILKRLRGTPLLDLEKEHGLIFNPAPPYDLLENKLISFTEMARIRRFARYWEMIGNSGRFTHTRELMVAGGSPFRDFMKLSDWLFEETGRTHRIALRKLFRLVYWGLLKGVGLDTKRCLEAVGRDFTHIFKEEKIAWLQTPPSPGKQSKTHKAA
ncbi:MAG: DUF4080 domain-containing protein [Magnetococcales bacterium]|nr:DUF4080 domain-containing protein [Magnetococcales bacterium]